MPIPVPIQTELICWCPQCMRIVYVSGIEAELNHAAKSSLEAADCRGVGYRKRDQTIRLRLLRYTTVSGETVWALLQQEKVIGSVCGNLLGSPPGRYSEVSSRGDTLWQIGQATTAINLSISSFVMSSPRHIWYSPTPCILLHLS